MILSLLFFALAAICNAIMDVCAHHFYESVFNSHNLDASLWNADVSWKNKYKDKDPAKGRTSTPVFLTDAWHFFKSLMVVFICIALTLLALGIYITTKHLARIDFLYMFIIYGAVWNLFFGIFYNRILIAKK